jgi:hypothetical protein
MQFLPPGARCGLRPSPFSGPCALALGALAALGLSACELGANFGDLGETLLDPDVQSVDVPGHRWVKGPHFNLNVLADQDGKRFAVARNADSELVIINFAEEHYCRAGQAIRYDAAVTARSRPALVPVLVQPEARGDVVPPVELTFTTFDCQRTSFSVPVGGLPSRVVNGLPTGSGTAVLVKSPDNALLLVDPWEQTTLRVAESVRSDDPAFAFGQFLWVDRGQIVISDEHVEPVASVGQNVSLVIASPEDAQLAYIDADGDDLPGGTLFTIDASASEAPTEIATQACGARYLTLDGRRKLSYFAPCAERQLVLRDVSDGVPRVIDQNVAGAPAVRTIGGRSALMYVTTAEPDAALGSLWLVQGDQPKAIIAENTRVGPSTVTGDGGLLTVLDWNDTGGRLVEWRSDALTEVAQGVIELGPLGKMANDDLTLLGNFDGVTGDLLRLRADLSTEVLAQGVPTRAANDDAFLANFDGEAGELMLFNRKDGSSEALAQGVARGAFIFTQQFRSLLMLSERDTETRTNTLRMHLLRSKRDYVLHDGVTEAREVAFPSPGVLYNVVVGDEAGIWFAKTL